MSERLDTQSEEWPLRPWIMAAICSVAALIFYLLTDYRDPSELTPSRQAGATFVVIEHNMEFVMSLCTRILVLAAVGTIEVSGKATAQFILVSLVTPSMIVLMSGAMLLFQLTRKEIVTQT